MPYFIDTSILGRLANAADVDYQVALNAISELHQRNESVFITPQVLIEFRAFATRPKAVNGLGLSSASAESQAAKFEAKFGWLDDTPGVYPNWKKLVAATGVIGKQVHDARLVAVCQVHGVTNLLTFNIGHFTRLAAFVPGLNIVHPANV